MTKTILIIIGVFLFVAVGVGVVLLTRDDSSIAPEGEAEPKIITVIEDSEEPTQKPDIREEEAVKREEPIQLPTPGPEPYPESETDSGEGLETKKEEKVDSFLGLRLKPFTGAWEGCFGRLGRFALDGPLSEEDRKLKEEKENMGEYLKEELDYEEMKVVQERIESFYEFLIELYPEDAECMKNNDEGREYDNSDFFKI